VTAALGVVWLAAACSGGAPAPHGRVVDVEERDFQISAAGSIPAGDVTIEAHNLGPDAHELIVVRAPQGALPLRDDGITVDEGVLSKAEVGALEPFEPRTTQTLQVHLDPGAYLFLCNMAGHYRGGMSTLVTVT
jgi:uncharacterized cupredoxin-like copper-binding protein